MIQNAPSTQPFGLLLRTWRKRRRLSQLDLALEANTSARHLSFLETGRSMPSREMLLDLAEHLAIPLRERNVLLTAAGYAPVFVERDLTDPEFQLARNAIDLILSGYEPYPALAIDRHWQLIASNDAVAPLLTGIDETLLTPPINVLRLTLHPNGLSKRIVNLHEWRLHLLNRLQQQIELTADPVLIDLLDECKAYAMSNATNVKTGTTPDDYAGIAVPFCLQTEHGVLAFFSITTIFGTPVDITLDELAIEAFLPANDATKAIYLQTYTFNCHR